jgi:hypothetical protein
MLEMNQASMNELFVEISSAFQDELTKRILDFIQDTKKHRKWWRRLIRWLNSIRRCHCACGSGGIEFYCERPPKVPLPIPVARLPVRSTSLARMTISEV